MKVTLDINVNKSDFSDLQTYLKQNDINYNVTETLETSRAELNGNYFYIDENNNVIATIDTWSPEENNKYDNGNYYLDFDEAFDEAERRKIIAQIDREIGLDKRKWDGRTEHYSISCSTSSNGVTTLNVEDWKSINQMNGFYFATERDAERAIELIGEKRIKKYFFGIKGPEDK